MINRTCTIEVMRASALGGVPKSHECMFYLGTAGSLLTCVGKGFGTILEGKMRLELISIRLWDDIGTQLLLGMHTKAFVETISQ